MVNHKPTAVKAAEIGRYQIECSSKSGDIYILDTSTGDVWILFVGTRENLQDHPGLNSLSGALIHLGRCERDNGRTDE